MVPKSISGTKDIKLTIAGYFSGSMELLAGQPLPGDAAIHDVRVLLKKHRAALKLVRPLLDETVYSREYRAARETGRLLASWRENAVLRKTAKALKKENPELFIRLRDNEKIQNLLRKPYSSWDEAGERMKTVKEVSERLKKAQYRHRFVSPGETDMKQLLSELVKSHEAASAAYLKCRHRPSPGSLHEFRKKGKTFMYQLPFFRNFAPQVVKQLEKRLNSLTQDLGRYNDLVEIIRLSGYRYGATANTDADNELAVVIKDRQDKYLMKVWPQAYKIFTPGRKLQDILGISF